MVVVRVSGEESVGVVEGYELRIKSRVGTNDHCPALIISLLDVSVVDKWLLRERVEVRVACGVCGFDWV